MRPDAGPGRDIAARATVAVNGSLIRRGVGPLPAEVGRPLRLDVTLTPKTGTEVTVLYLGIAGPGSWGDERAKPVGQYAILLHEKRHFAVARHFTVTWKPAAYARVGPVHLSIFYTVADYRHPALIEQIPVTFRVFSPVATEPADD